MTAHTSSRGRALKILLWLLAAALLLVASLALAAYLYWNHLVRTYTSTSPRLVPSVEGAADKYPALKERWDAFALLFLHPEREIPPFTMSAEDLNVFATRFGPFGKQAFLELRPKAFRIQFSAPLETTGHESLRGRFLNGIAILSPRIDHGQLDVRLTQLEANGLPFPGWMLRWAQKWNLADRLNHRAEFDLAIRNLQSLDISSDQLVLRPRLNGSPSPTQ